mgnify:CR=1 FL=1
MNILDIVFYSSKKTSYQSQKGWLFKCLGLILIFVVFVFFFFVFLLAHFRSYFIPYFFAIFLFMCSDLLFKLAVKSSYFMYNPMHQNNISALIMAIVFTCLWVLVEMAFVRHFVSIRTKYEMHVTQFQLKRFRKQVPN